MPSHAPNRPPLPLKAVENLKKCIRSRNTFLKADSLVIFVCGAMTKPDKPSNRDMFIRYAQKHFMNFQFFKAEDVFSALQERYYSDLLSLEDTLAEFSDCIIIILESEGAFAELGAFTIKDDLANIVLIINDVRFKTSLSFINQGPIAKADKKSIFRPTIHTQLNRILYAEPEIAERLGRIERKNNERIPLSSIAEFKSVKRKIKMLFLLDLIAFCSPLSRQDLIFLLKQLYGEHKFDIKVELSLLRTLRLIHWDEPYYVRSFDDNKLFFDFKGINEIQTRSEIVNYYHKYSKSRIGPLTRRALNEFPVAKTTGV